MSRAAGPRLIIKLGGSFAGSPLLGRWLEAIARLDAPVIVTPGGGPFADAIRHVQPVLGYDDRAAHAMALLAMAQYGHALASLHGGFEPAGSLAAMDAALERGKVPLWRPYPMALEDPAIPQSWDITSDSLAAWLAGRVGARGLILVKSVAPSAPSCAAEELAREGVVDPAFPGFLAKWGGAARWLGPEAFSSLPELLNKEGQAGALIRSEAAGEAYRPASPPASR